MTLGIVLAAILASNASGKQLVRAQPGSLVPKISAKRTNYATNPRSACAAGNVADTGWSFATAACTNNTATDPTGGSGMDTITTSANNGSAYTSNTVPSSAGPFTSSAFVRSVSGTAIQSVGGACASGTATAVACTRSDGGVCATGVSGINAWVYATLGTDVVRMSVTWMCDSAVTTIYGFYHDGRHTLSSGVGGMFWGLKLEVGASATPL